MRVWAILLVIVGCGNRSTTHPHDDAAFNTAVAPDATDTEVVPTAPPPDAPAYATPGDVQPRPLVWREQDLPLTSGAARPPLDDSHLRATIRVPAELMKAALQKLEIRAGDYHEALVTGHCTRAGAGVTLSDVTITTTRVTLTFSAYAGLVTCIDLGNECWTHAFWPIEDAICVRLDTRTTVRVSGGLAIDDSLKVTVSLDEVSFDGKRSPEIETLLRKHLPLLESEANATLDVPAKATTLWSELSRPIALTDQITLRVVPTTLATPLVRGTNGAIAVDLDIAGTAALLVGPDTSTEKKTTTSLPLATPPTGQGDTILTLDGYADITLMSEALKRATSGASIPAGRGKIIKILGATLKSRRGLLVAVFNVGGDYSGKLAISGLPAYCENNTLCLKFPDYSSDKESSVAPQGKELIKAMLSEHLRWPLLNDLRLAASLLSAALTRESGLLKIEGQFGVPTVVGIYVEESKVIVRMRVVGQLSASVH